MPKGGGKRLGAPLRPSTCRTATAQVEFSGRPLCKVPPFAPSAIYRKIGAPVKNTAPSAKGSTTCACAWTVSTIARIAGKPVKSPLPAPVATEAKSFLIQIGADARLAAAVGGAARYLADIAGLKEEATAQFQSSVVAACREAFDHLTEFHPRLKVTLSRFADRIEVALTHQGETLPAVGLDSIAGFAAQIGGSGAGPSAFSGVDRVQRETHGGETVTRLTKYIAKVNLRN
jgi:hypothetical protein